MPNLASLPGHLLALITQHLTLPERCRLSQTCTMLQEVMRHPQVDGAALLCMLAARNGAPIVSAARLRGVLQSRNGIQFYSVVPCCAADIAQN